LTSSASRAVEVIRPLARSRTIVETILVANFSSPYTRSTRTNSPGW
jgi:hypothetical protein